MIAIVSVAGACTARKFGPPLQPYQAIGRIDVPMPPTLEQKAHMARIASLKDRAIGPSLARSDKASLAVYVAAAEGVERPVVAILLGPDGAPKQQARVVAKAAPDTSTLVVRHTRADGGGYLVAWTSLTDRGEALSLVGVGEDGVPRASAIELARTPDHIVWSEIVPTARGAVCVWAEEPPQGSANVLAQALDSSGKPRGVPSRVVRGVTSWQAVATNDGVALAVVSPQPSQGSLSLVKLDVEARVLGEPMPIAKNVTPDMDFVRASNGALVFVWTDRTRTDPALTIAAVDAQNKLVAPHEAVQNAGSSVLVSITSGENGEMLLWEPAHKRERMNRRVNAALIVDPSQPASTKNSFDLAGGAAIEARARSDGFSLVVSAHACNLANECGAVAPTYLRLDPSLAVMQTEALVLGPPVSLAWNLDCASNEKKNCLVLAAGPDSPTSVYAIDLGERPSVHEAPVAKALPEDAPRIVSTATLTSGARVADVASVRIGETPLVASIAERGTDEKTHEERAGLYLTTGASTQTLSTKALAVGGVAMTLAPNGKEAVIAYVSKDGNARVHLVRVDDHGARRGEVVLGAARGDASDVSITRAFGGFVVAWVDTRDGNGEVYTASLGADLANPREWRVTNAPGDATDTALAATDDGIVLAWADPRESPHDGFADIYAIALARDAKPIGREGRVLSTAAHSRSPVLTPTASGIALAWIEEAPAGAASEEAKGAMFVMLDAKAHALRDPIKLHLRDAGTVTAIALDTDANGARLLHAVATRVDQDELWIDAARIPLDAAGNVDSYPLVPLDGPSSLDVALALHGDSLIFSDDGPDASDARVRRAVVAWKK